MKSIQALAALASQFVEINLPRRSAIMSLLREGLSVREARSLMRSARMAKDKRRKRHKSRKVVV